MNRTDNLCILFHSLFFVALSVMLSCGASVQESVRDDSYTKVIDKIGVVIISAGLEDNYDEEAATAMVNEARTRGIKAQAFVVHNDKEFENGLAASKKAGMQAALVAQIDTIMTQYGEGTGAYINVSLLDLSTEDRIIWRSNIFNPWTFDKNHESFANTVFDELNEERLIR